MNPTDIIIILISIYYFICGWQKGFLRTIFGPISLIIGSAVSYIYFQQTHQLLISLLIGLIGPFLLNFILNLLIKLWQKTTDREKEFFTIGKLLGGLFSLIWGITITSLIALLIVLSPFKIAIINTIQDNIKHSTYYALLNKFFSIEKKKKMSGLETVQEILNNPDKIAKFQKTEAFQELINDKKLKKIFQDETTLDQIKKKDVAALLKNPEFLEILKDEELGSKLLTAYKEMIKSEKPGNKDGDDD